jgi:hypothetical protein
VSGRNNSSVGGVGRVCGRVIGLVVRILVFAAVSLDRSWMPPTDMTSAARRAGQAQKRGRLSLSIAVFA